MEYGRCMAHVTQGKAGYDDGDGGNGADDKDCNTGDAHDNANNVRLTRKRCAAGLLTASSMVSSQSTDMLFLLPCDEAGRATNPLKHIVSQGNCVSLEVDWCTLSKCQKGSAGLYC
eukprot:784572-Pelagomonas_calceolata.AAC.2